MAVGPARVHHLRDDLLSITFNSAGFNGLLIDDWPWRIVVSALAIVLWVIYWRMSRSMRLSRP